MWRVTDSVTVRGPLSVTVVVDRNTLVSPVDYVTYFHVINTSTDANTLIIIPETSVDHRTLSEFQKPVINYEKKSSLTSLVLTSVGYDDRHRHRNRDYFQHRVTSKSRCL